VVRRFRLSDYDAVLTLWRRTEGVGLNESDTRSAVASYLRRNAGLSCVAAQGGEIVGAVLCGHDGRRGYLHHLAVARRHRRRGIGRRLVAACLAKLGRLGITRCNLFIFADNAAGKKFWAHRGWKLRRELRLMQIPVAGARRGDRSCSC